MAVWATTDLHGNYDLWEQIKNFLKEDDTLIFLGDAIDRGSRGFEIFKELLEDPRVCYLKGNHEDMMYNSFTAIGPAGTEYFKEWRGNDGQITYDNMKATEINRKESLELIYKIDELPCWAQYTNKNGIRIILSHAGFHPSPLFHQQDEWKKEQILIWDRKHFEYNWPQDKEYETTILVHGHTPILLQKQMYKKYSNATGMAPYWYENNHKVNLDAATANTGLAFLLNLDTFDYELFVADPDYPVYKKKK